MRLNRSARHQNHRCKSRNLSTESETTCNKNQNIIVRDSVFEPSNKTGKVKIRSDSKKRPRYRVNLYLEGEALPYVKRVTYKLHPTFPDRVKIVERSASNPKLSIGDMDLGPVRDLC